MPDVARLVERTTAASGVPIVPVDRAALAQVAALRCNPIPAVATVVRQLGPGVRARLPVMP